MSETPVVPAPADPADATPAQRVSVLRYLSFVLIGGAGCVAIMVIAAAAYGIAREYGSPSVPWLGIAAWALLPAALWTVAMLLLRQGLGSRLWSPWLVGLVVLVLTTVLAGSLTAVAASAHDTELSTSAAACSPADVAVLTSVPGYSADLGEPTGQGDGSCSILLGANADAAGAVASVVAGMVAGGWDAAPAAADGSVQVARSGVYVVVRAGSSDGKGWTDVVVEIPAG